MPNPYTPPRESQSNEPIIVDVPFERGTKRGPALYIVLCGLLGGFIAGPFLVRYNPIGLALPLVGCVVGGIVYRVRARHWPVDPTVRTRQLQYIIMVMTLVPGTLFLLVGVRAQGGGIVIIGGIVGAAVSAGILASGTRRDGVARNSQSQHVN